MVPVDYVEVRHREVAGSLENHRTKDSVDVAVVSCRKTVGRMIELVEGLSTSAGQEADHAAGHAVAEVESKRNWTSRLADKKLVVQHPSRTVDLLQ
jgi:hypothetical protein